MVLSYRSSSNADMSKFKIVHILVVDVQGLQCKVQALDGGSTFYVKLTSSVGLFYTLPSPNEEWVVELIGATWYLHSKTRTQNPAIAELSNCNAGDVILNATGDIRVISPLVQANVTNSWSNSASITAGGTPQEIGELSLVESGNTSVATVSTVTSRLKMLKSGTYAICCTAETNPHLAIPERLLVEILFQGRMRRSSSYGEDRGMTETILPLQKDDILAFKIYYSGTAGPLTFDTRIDITQVR